MPRNLESRVERLEQRSGTGAYIEGPCVIWLGPLEFSEALESARLFKGASIDGVFHAPLPGEDIDTFEKRLAAQVESELREGVRTMIPLAIKLYG